MSLNFCNLDEAFNSNVHKLKKKGKKYSKMGIDDEIMEKILGRSKDVNNILSNEGSSKSSTDIDYVNSLAET